MYRSTGSSVGFGRSLVLAFVEDSDVRDVTDTRVHTFDRTHGHFCKALACCVYRMSTRQSSDDLDVDVNTLHREVGADSVAGTPTRRMQTRQQRREAEDAALQGPNTQSGTAPASVQNPYFDQLVSGREFDDEYDESEYVSGLASVWQPTATHHVNAQQASTSHHVNAQSAANPSMTDADTLARAFTQYASMSSGVSWNVPEKKALANAKSEKPKWDTQKEPFHTFKRRVMIWAERSRLSIC